MDAQEETPKRYPQIAATNKNEFDELLEKARREGRKIKEVWFRNGCHFATANPPEKT